MIDAFSRRIAGWSTRTTITTEALALEALEHALVTAKDQALQGLIHHRDRGCQYVSMRYTQRLTDAGIHACVGSRGDSYDNALAKTVNGLYKTELIHTQATWPSLTKVEFHTMCWVNSWNNQRLHESLGYRTPTEVEQDYHQTREPVTALT